MANVVIVSDAGYPYTPSSLMMDNCFGNFAATLSNAGHNPLFIDYGTVDSMRRLMPRECRDQLASIYRQFSALSYDNSAEAMNIKIGLVQQLKKVDAALILHRERVDAEKAEEISAIVEEHHADLLGFKIYLGDGFVSSERIASYVRKNNPGVKIVYGGPTIDMLMGRLYLRTQVPDVLAYCEGEETIVHLAEWAEGKRELNFPNLILRDGTITKKSRITNLNDLPLPDYDPGFHPYMNGDQKMKIAIIDDSRGCNWMKCGFCPQPNKSGYQRLKTPERLFEDQKHVAETTTRVMRYGGSSTPLDLMADTARLVNSSGLDIITTSFLRTDTITEEDLPRLREMKKAGMDTLLFGVETGTQECLDRIPKGVTLKQIQDSFRYAKEAGINRVGSLIVPVPGDTPETIKQTLDFMIGLNPDSVFISFPGLFPGIPWVNQSEKYGFKIDIPDYDLFVLDYKIKSLFPPQLWEPLPYSIEGKSFQQFASITADAEKTLEKAGLRTRLTDEMFAFARLIGVSIDDFKPLIQEVIYTGDWERMQDMLMKFNREATKRPWRDANA
jgi:anaerobic magnesium-protoporphyrin IX monomethyl ester cyclase